jgi:DNA-binding NarL/FixJ family response regulator
MNPSAADRPLVVHSLKVLLVEDSTLVAERLREVISHIGGVNLIGTTNIAVASKQDVDVIVLDLHLKQGTGFGVMRALTTVRRKPTIIVLTNYDLPEYKKASLALGATHFLDKARDFARLPQLLTGIQKELSALH